MIGDEEVRKRMVYRECGERVGVYPIMSDESGYYTLSKGEKIPVSPRNGNNRQKFVVGTAYQDKLPIKVK